MRKIAWLCLPLVILLAGCATVGSNKPTTIYPIQDDDIYSAPAGAEINIPVGTTVKDEKGNVIESYPQGKKQVVKKNSWVLSDFYLQEVMSAKMKK